MLCFLMCSSRHGLVASNPPLTSPASLPEILRRWERHGHGALPFPRCQVKCLLPPCTFGAGDPAHPSSDSSQGISSPVHCLAPQLLVLVWLLRSKAGGVPMPSCTARCKINFTRSPLPPGSTGQERSPHPGSPEYLVVPSPAPSPIKNPKRQRSGEHGPGVLNLRTRPRNLEEFPGVPGAPHARHPAAGDARAGGYLLSTSCQSPREARPLGTAGPVRGDVCQEGGTRLGALPGRDGMGHMRRAGCVPTLGLIPIFLQPHHLGEPVSGVYPGV